MLIEHYVLYPYLYSDVVLDGGYYYTSSFIIVGNFASLLVVESIIFLTGSLMADNRIKTEE